MNENNNPETDAMPVTNEQTAPDDANGCAFEMEIFRAGDYGAKGSWTPEDLDAIAADYTPERHEAPLTLDHASSGPAIGWVEHLRRVGDRLIAKVHGVPNVVAELIRRGNYKQRSAELVRKFRDTGKPYLRAVSLLGAAIPEVKGLRPIQFSENDEVSCVDSEPDGIAALRAELNTLRRKLIMSDLQCAGVTLTDEQTTAFCDMMDALPNGMRVSFAEDEPKLTPAQWFTRLMAQFSASHLSQQMPLPLMGEAAPEAAAKVDDTAVADAFSEEMSAELESLRLRRTAEDICRNNPDKDYSAALLMAAKSQQKH